MTKNPSMRLGCGSAGEDAILVHPFFATVDWEALEARKVKAPFIPAVVCYSLIQGSGNFFELTPKLFYEQCKYPQIFKHRNILNSCMCSIQIEGGHIFFRRPTFLNSVFS